MGKTYETIEGSIAEFIEQQQMFFVATAPLAGDGLLNLSPKGLDSLRVLDKKTVAYADLAGSGVETIAHLKQNGRIVLMFCAFEGPPKIVRLHGQGEVLEPDTEGFLEIASNFPEFTGIRSFIRVNCTRISDSCGYGVPRYDYQAQRTTLTDSSAKKGPEAMMNYVRENNAQSLDGLEGLRV